MLSEMSFENVCKLGYFRNFVLTKNSILAEAHDEKRREDDSR